LPFGNAVIKQNEALEAGGMSIRNVHHCETRTDEVVTGVGESVKP
jgi:hypothetical protein